MGTYSHNIVFNFDLKLTRFNCFGTMYLNVFAFVVVMVGIFMVQNGLKGRLQT